MTREEILKDPEVSHYCDAKRGWVHEAFMDGVDYAERKMGSMIKWQTGEPKESGSYLITTSNGKVFADYWRVYPNRCDWYYRDKFDVKAWCKFSDIEPYKEEQP